MMPESVLVLVVMFTEGVNLGYVVVRAFRILSDCHLFKNLEVDVYDQKYLDWTYLEKKTKNYKI